MKIGLITYNRPHRKTYDLACMLKLEGYKVAILIVDFNERPQRKPLIQHRLGGIKYRPYKIADVFGWEAKTLGSIDVDKYLIGGCNVIPGLKALNAHPGYLPYSRGLDAIKWAIYNEVPIGVTVHETTDETTDEPDKGPVYLRRIIPLYFEDTFHSFAERIYQNELSMLIESITIKYPEKWEVINNPITDVVHKRMPAYKERIMLERFEALRRNSKSIYE